MPFRSALAGLLVALAAVALLPRASVADPDGAAAGVAGAVERVLADSTLPSAVWGVVVRDLRTGETVFSRNGETPLLPASTLKLVTTATALDALGPDYRYTTGLYHLGPAVGRDSVLRGTLAIRGAGDPTFGSSGEGDPLRAWAARLRASGVRRVEGRIVGDDGRFEDARYAEGWDALHVATEAYAPASGGLAWADNLLNVQIRGTQAGRPAEVEASPAGFAEIEGEVRTRGGGGAGLSVVRAPGSDLVVLDGAVPARYQGTLRLPVANPTLYAVHAFADRLRAAGIEVAAALADEDDLDDDLDYGDAEPLLTYRSPPLREIVERTNRESDNLYAEHLLRTVAPDGSVEGGTRRVEAFMTEAGADGDALAVHDGSGLSRKDLVTPQSLVAVLAAMWRHPAGAAFRASLPEGGGAGSTLRNRLGGVPVRAKTGSLEYVRCLAGYVTGPDGRPYAFALMANNYTESGRLVARAQDRIVRALATGRDALEDE